MPRQATPEEKEIAATMEAVLAAEPVVEEQPGPAPLELNPDDLEPVKRKPGRPAGGGAKKTEELLHQTIEGDSVSGKPGRKPRAKVEDKRTNIDPGKLGSQLVGIHQLAAMFTNTPELQLTDQAGRALGEAIVNVCNEYDLNISGKTGSMLQLLATSCMIYAPMFMAIRFRYAQEELARGQADQTQYNAAGYPNVPAN